jgi:hypothetical protein
LKTLDDNYDDSLANGIRERELLNLIDDNWSEDMTRRIGKQTKKFNYFWKFLLIYQQDKQKYSMYFEPFK